MQSIGRQPQRAPDGVPVHYERHRQEQAMLYGLVQQHAATIFEQTEAEAGADLPQFVKDEFDAFLERGVLAHGFLRLHCSDCGQQPAQRQTPLQAHSSLESRPRSQAHTSLEKTRD